MLEIEKLRALPVAERLQLVEDLWDSIAGDPGAVRLTATHIAELDKRLDRLEEYAGEISTMAQRHTGYGVKPDHYKMVGNALLWTLEKGLGKDWTPAVKESWTKAYGIIADTMIHAASEKGALHQT